MMRALVTGAAGLIGLAAVREFVGQGWEVVALIHRRRSDELDALAEQGSVRVVQGDAADVDGMRGIVTESAPLDVIAHCAGRASDVGWRSAFRRDNFQSVEVLVELVREFEVGRLVFVSTTDVYGLHDFTGETEEGCDYVARPRNPYPEFKIAAERLIMSALATERYVIVRPAAVWGRGDQTLTPRILSFLKASPWIIHFGKWRGSNRWPLAHVRNVATAIFLAADMKGVAGEAINVLDEEVTSVDEFYRLLLVHFLPEQQGMRSVALPLWIGLLMGGVVTLFSNLLNLSHPFMDPSLYAVRTVSSNLDFSNAKLKALMQQAGLCMVTREEGLRELE